MVDLERFISDDVRLAARIQWQDSETPSAARRLEGWARESNNLPLVDLLPLQNLAFELEVLRPVLARLTVDPTEVLKLVGDDGETLWVIPPRCSARFWHQTWTAKQTLELETVPQGWLGREAVASSFEIALGRDGSVFLADHGRAAAALRRFAQPKLQLASSDDASLAAQLESIAPAPVRVAIRGIGLLAESSRANVRHPTLRVTKDAVTLGVR